MITSDDPDGTIAYYTNGEKAYIPKQAGTVTFTATIEDTNPQTGETKTVSGDSTVTFVYKNNVKTVELAEENKNMTVEAGKSSAVFAPIVTGELDDQGYDVTEPALKWTYSQRGIAQVVRTGSGYWKKNGDYKSSDYKKVAVNNRIANENKSLKIEDKTKIPNIESEQNSENQEITEDVTVEESAIEENAIELPTIFSAFMASDRTAEISTKKEVPTEITSDEGNADTVIGTGMAMSSAMATSVPTPQIEINAPSGFETTDTYNGGAAFESENGGRIDVNYYYSGNDDTEPVYNEYENDVSAYFTEDKIDYNIYGTDTGREPVEEVVNSIK